MSLKPIWSLNAKRSELGGATKGQIYLSKIGIGFVCWVPCWLVSLGALTPTIHLCLAIFLTSKVCWHINLKDYSIGWDSLADWCTDGALHCAWLCVWWLFTGNYTGAGILAGLWLCSYPWSSE